MIRNQSIKFNVRTFLSLRLKCNGDVHEDGEAVPDQGMTRPPDKIGDESNIEEDSSVERSRKKEIFQPSLEFLFPLNNKF